MMDYGVPYDDVDRLIYNIASTIWNPTDDLKICFAQTSPAERRRMYKLAEVLLPYLLEAAGRTEWSF
jgi:hypothetical protein